MKKITLIKAAWRTAIAVVLGSAIAAEAATFTYQQGVAGYVGTVDLLMRQDQPDTANTTGNIYVDGSESAGDPIHSLLRFNDIFGDGPG